MEPKDGGKIIKVGFGEKNRGVLEDVVGVEINCKDWGLQGTDTYFVMNKGVNLLPRDKESVPRFIDFVLGSNWEVRDQSKVVNKGTAREVFYVGPKIGYKEDLLWVGKSFFVRDSFLNFKK